MLDKKWTVTLLSIVVVSGLSLVVFSNFAKAETNDEKTCTVYFTAMGCENCKITDPVVLEEWPNKYDNLVVIEYMFYNWGEENARLLGEYAQKYGSWASVPQLFITSNKIALGRIEIPNAEDEIKNLKSNNCLIEGFVSFNELDLNNIDGEPLKIWSNGRLLIRIKRSEAVSSDFLRELLFSNDLDSTIEDSTYNIETIEAEPAPISHGQIDFTNALKIEDSWTLSYNEVEEEGTTITTHPTGKGGKNIIELPFFGKIDTTKMSLPILTAVIAGADGFNPCAFFIMVFLLSTMLYARSRKRVFLVGGIFVFFSGLIYFLFMCAWLNVFLFVKEITLLTMVAGIIALVAGLINIKDYFFFKKGISLTLSTSEKLKFFEKVKNLTKAESLLPLVMGTIILAVTVNMYELLCTVGFPMVYTRVLTLHNLPTLQYYLYLIFYNVIYVIPLAALVLIFAITLGKKKFGEESVKKLKLISGFMILFLGLVLLLKPSLLENVFAAFGIIISALLISGAIITARKIKFVWR